MTLKCLRKCTCFVGRESVVQPAANRRTPGTIHKQVTHSMRISIFTLPRPVEYLSATLDNLFAVDPRANPDNVALYYQATEAPELRHALGHIELASQELLGLLSKVPPGERATYNYARSLKWLAAGNQNGLNHQFGIALEDDLIFARNFTSRVESLCRMAHSLTPRFMISLHHFYDLKKFHPAGRAKRAGGADDALLKWTDPNSFYGSQAMAFPSGIAGELSDAFISKLGPLGSPLPPNTHLWYMDMGLKRLAMERRIILYTVHPCLIQHVGAISVVCERRAPLVNQHFDPN